MNRLLLAFILVVFSLGLFKASQYHTPKGFHTRPKVVPGNYDVRFESRFASSKQHIQTHAPSLIELKDGRIRAFWFSGSREGAKDVEIRSAVFDPGRKLWGAEETVASRKSTQRSVMRYVKSWAIL